MEKLLFRPAKPTETGLVYDFYQQARQTPFCVWDDEYPTRQMADADQAAGNLFVLGWEGEPIGALSVVSENELDHCPGWHGDNKRAREIGRIVIAKEHQGHGYAGFMVGSILEILRTQGWGSVRLSAAKGNLPARKTYAKVGFTEVGEAELYGGEYVLLEYLL